MKYIIIFINLLMFTTLSCKSQPKMNELTLDEYNNIKDIGVLKPDFVATE